MIQVWGKYISHSLNSLKGVAGGLGKGLLHGLLGVKTMAYMFIEYLDL